MSGPFGTRERKNYVKIIGGQFATKAKEGDPGAEPRTIDKGKNAGNVVWERKHPSLEGVRITNIRKKTFEDGKKKLTSLEIVLDYQGEEYIVSVQHDSGYAEDFLMRLPNADISKEVSLVPYAIESDEERNSYGIVIYQEGNKIERYWGGKESGKPVLPAWKKVSIGEEIHWDRSEYRNMMWEKAISCFSIENMANKPDAISSSKGSGFDDAVNTRPPETLTGKNDIPEEEDNDLPF